MPNNTAVVQRIDAPGSRKVEMNMSVIFSAAVFNAGGVFHILCVQAIDHFVVTTVTCDCYPSQNTR